MGVGKGKIIRRCSFSLGVVWEAIVRADESRDVMAESISGCVRLEVLLKLVAYVRCRDDDVM